MKTAISSFRSLVLLNAALSCIITYVIILYNIENIDQKILLIISYALIWFYTLYKIYNFSKLGLNLYVILVVLGFILNALSDIKVYGKFYYTTSLFEHIVIGGILALSYLSKIKGKFR